MPILRLCQMPTLSNFWHVVLLVERHSKPLQNFYWLRSANCIRIYGGPQAAESVCIHHARQDEWGDCIGNRRKRRKLPQFSAANDFTAFLVWRKFVSWHLKCRIYLFIITNHSIFSRSAKSLASSSANFVGRVPLSLMGLTPLPTGVILHWGHWLWCGCYGVLVLYCLLTCVKGNTYGSATRFQVTAELSILHVLTCQTL